jgi:hypothetical protein
MLSFTRIPSSGSGYLALHMRQAQPVSWRFEAAATDDALAPDRVKWRFKLDPYAGGEVRSFVPPYTETIGAHRPITIEVRALSEWEISEAGQEKGDHRGRS